MIETGVETMMRKSVVSIDIGSCKTKIAVGSLEKDRIIIEKTIMIDTPKGSFKEGRFLNTGSDASELGNAIAKALHDNRVRCKDAIITFQSTLIIKRELEIPKVKPKDMESMIRYEIGQYLPIDLNEYIVEYKILDDRQENMSRILIAALPKEIGGDFYNILNQIKLEPKALDINSNSTSKLYTFEDKMFNNSNDLELTSALIDLGYSQTNIIIVSKGYFQFSRLLPVGGRDIDAAISDMYGIPEQEAEMRKLEEVDLKGFSKDTEAKTINVVAAEVIARWIEDIQRVFQYYKSRNANNDIDQMYLYGGTSNVKGIEEYFENTAGIPVKKVLKLDNVVFEKDAAGVGVERLVNSIGAMIRR